MYALAFDLEMAELRRHWQGHVSGAYLEIKNVLIDHGFQWAQGSLYILDQEDMSVLFRAIQALIALPWFPPSVRDIRAFRVEQWSDFTATVKGASAPPRSG
ncbi:MAG: virulence factor [Deltaproteobacteria bacterium]|nr:virulence factor [Deltaproteobacteria bacterium]